MSEPPVSDAVSLYGGIDPKPVQTSTWTDVLHDIRECKHADQIDNARAVLASQGLGEYGKIKKNLPAVTFSGTFSRREKTGILSSSGFIIPDLDHLTDIESVFNLLIQDENIWFVFRSPSGEGLKCGIRAQGIRDDYDHKRLFAAVREYFSEGYQLHIDESCKDISRLTFLSSDARAFINPEPHYFDLDAWADAEPFENPSVNTDTGNGALLDWICRRIAESVPGAQHITRLHMARLAGGLQGLDEGEAMAAMERAVIASGAKDLRAAMQTVRDGFAHGRQYPVPEAQIVTDDTDTEAECCVLPSPPPVPFQAFPKPIQAIIQDAARAFVVPLEVPTVAVLALAAGCIGRARALVVKTGWTPHANLYLALVGASGTGKSPCVNKILSAVHRVDYRMHEVWTAELAAYEVETERYRTATKAHLHGKGADPGPPPKRPPRRRILADDESIESLVDAFSDNPRGILWQRDELAGLLLDLDKYSGKNGATKTRLMSCYDAGPIKVGRIAQNRIAHIPHAALSIFGGIQPAALVDAFCTKDQLTGFLPRFLFVRFRPGGPSLWTDAVFDHDTELDHIVRGLLGLELDVQGRPVYIGMTDDARQVYIDWHDRLSMKAWMGSGDDEQSVLSKLRDQCLRLALILHLLEAVTTGADDTTAVAVGTMKRAILLSEWFREHQRAVWQLISSTSTSEQTPLIRRVAAAIVDLAGEIKSGLLFTAAITDRVNACKDKAFHIDPRAVGRACSKLGLPGKRTGSARMISVSEDALIRLRAIGNVTNVTNVTEPKMTKLSGDDVLKSSCHTCHCTDRDDAGGNDVNDIKKNNVIDGTACGYRLNDVNDDNDVIFSDISKSTHSESEPGYEEGTI